MESVHIAINALAGEIEKDNPTASDDACAAWAVAHVNEAILKRSASSGMSGMTAADAEAGLADYLTDRRQQSTRAYLAQYPSPPKAEPVPMLEFTVIQDVDEDGVSVIHSIPPADLLAEAESMNISAVMWMMSDDNRTWLRVAFSVDPAARTWKFRAPNVERSRLEHLQSVINSVIEVSVSDITVSASG